MVIPVEPLTAMNKKPENGTRQDFDGRECIYYDGYWIRFYAIPGDTLAVRKMLIDTLTRRTFHHTEAGINTPGERLEEARQAYEKATHPARKRVNAAMLAGALFNRATDIFTAIVELEHKGIKVSHDNELMRQCSHCFRQALELGKQVRHYSGEEGIDELWGEPFKAFTQPIAQVFQSRYRKIAQAMRDIDQIADQLCSTMAKFPAFAGVVPALQELAVSAKRQIETMKSDHDFFTVWPEFIANREAVEDYQPRLSGELTREQQHLIEQGVNLIKAGAALITYLSEARVPMPKSTQEILTRCETFEREKHD